MFRNVLALLNITTKLCCGLPRTCLLRPCHVIFTSCRIVGSGSPCKALMPRTSQSLSHFAISSSHSDVCISALLKRRRQGRTDISSCLRTTCSYADTIMLYVHVIVIAICNHLTLLPISCGRLASLGESGDKSKVFRQTSRGKINGVIFIVIKGIENNHLFI